jgi:signal transduction histidine kinase
MKNTQLSPAGETILVVDDTPDNARLLVNILAQEGYAVKHVQTGTAALTIARAELPDLILLDVMMPQMDGYEVCRQLKADPCTQDIPVIFITALSQTLDKVKAFSTGGVDYITKPFEFDEVLARVETHLALQRVQKSLQEQVAELDAFAHTVAHDLKNPLALMMNYAHILMEMSETIDRSELATHLRTVQQASHKAISIVDELLLLASVRKAEVKPRSLDMEDIVGNTQRRLKFMIEEYGGEIILPESWPPAEGYAPWIEEVWTNYLSNGLKYGGHPPRLELGATVEEGGMVRFWVRDNGPGLDPEEQARLFAEFTRLGKVRAQGHGLGLSIVRRIMEKSGGQAGVESEVGQGSLFYFTLPHPSPKPS